MTDVLQDEHGLNKRGKFSVLKDLFWSAGQWTPYSNEQLYIIVPFPLWKKIHVKEGIDANELATGWSGKTSKGTIAKSGI